MRKPTSALLINPDNQIDPGKPTIESIQFTLHKKYDLQSVLEDLIEAKFIDGLPLDKDNLLVFNAEECDLTQERFLWQWNDGFEVFHHHKGLIVSRDPENSSTTYDDRSAGDQIRFFDRLNDPWFEMPY